MTPLSKWIEGLAPDVSVSVAARFSIEDRLATVAYWLPLAARQSDDDTEKVHQLRVATRRAIAALKLYRDWLPRRPRRWLSKRLTEARQAAGAARDLDVLMTWLRQELGEEENCALEIAVRERSDAQQPIVAIAKKCSHRNRLDHTTTEVIARVSPRDPAAVAYDDSFEEWAVTRLARAAQPFFASSPIDANDLEALHQFRILGKRLRYTIELVAPALGSQVRKKHYSTIQKLQELLGCVNDCVVGAAQLRKWRQATKNSQQRRLLEQLIDRERLELDAAIDEYNAWWTAERADALRKGLATAGDVHEIKTAPQLADQLVPERHR